MDVKVPRRLSDTLEFGLELNVEAARSAGEKFARNADDLEQRTRVDQGDSGALLQTTRRVNADVIRRDSAAVALDTADRQLHDAKAMLDASDRIAKLHAVPQDRVAVMMSEMRQYYDRIRARYHDAVADVKKFQGSRDSSSWWSTAKSTVEGVLNIMTVLGFDTRFLTPRGAIAEAGRALTQLHEDRSAAYRAAGQGLGISPYEVGDEDLGVSGGIQQYIQGVRDVRQRWPSMASQLDTVVMNLRRNLPLADMRGTFRMVDDARRYAVYTTGTTTGSGQAAQVIGETARLYHETGEQAVHDLVYLNEMARSFVELSGVNIDLEEFRTNTINLGKLALPLGLSLHEAAELTFKFADSLNRGAVSIQDLITMISGYIKGGRSHLEYLFGMMVKRLDPEGENREFLDLLRPFAENYMAGSRLLESILTRNREGYAEAGIGDRFGDADRFIQMFDRAVGSVIEQDLRQFGIKSRADWDYWHARLLENFGVLSKGHTPDEQLALMEGGDPVGKKHVAQGEAAAQRYTGEMAGWRRFVDENNNLTEDTIDRMSNFVHNVFGRIVNWQQWSQEELPIVGKPKDVVGNLYNQAAGAAASSTASVLGKRSGASSGKRAVKEGGLPRGDRDPSEKRRFRDLPPGDRAAYGMPGTELDLDVDQGAAASPESRAAVVTITPSRPDIQPDGTDRQQRQKSGSP
jgi:hypothetical protein